LISAHETVPSASGTSISPAEACFYHLDGVAIVNVQTLESLWKVLQEAVDSCFRPMMLAKRFVVWEDVDAFTLGFESHRVFVGG
jgi:hypothetical protein